MEFISDHENTVPFVFLYCAKATSQCFYGITFRYCAECQVISLGLYLKQYSNYKADLNRLGIHPWFSSKHNMGMVINSNTWSLIKNCTNVCVCLLKIYYFFLMNSQASILQVLLSDISYSYFANMMITTGIGLYYTLARSVCRRDYELLLLKLLA